VQSDIYEVISPYVEADLVDLKFVQSADVLYLVHPTKKQYTLTRFANDSWAFSVYAKKNGPFMESNTVETNTITASAGTGAGITLTAINDTFNANHVGALWKLRMEIKKQVATGTMGAALVSDSIKC
jgi:hypothetical protein